MSVSTPERREADYRRLFADVYDDAVRFAVRRADPSDADDAVATAMLTAWRRFDDAPDSLDSQRAWVFGIVRKTLLNARRGRARHAGLAVRIAAAEATATPDDLAGVELRIDLARAWRTLSAQQQEVLSLAIFEQLGSADAARVLGILPAAYRVRLSRARKALRAALTADLADSADASVDTTPIPRFQEVS